MVLKMCMVGRSLMFLVPGYSGYYTDELFTNVITLNISSSMHFHLPFSLLSPGDEEGLLEVEHDNDLAASNPLLPC